MGNHVFYCYTPKQSFCTLVNDKKKLPKPWQFPVLIYNTNTTLAILQNSKSIKNYSILRNVINTFIHYSLLLECLRHWEECFLRHNTVVFSSHNTKSTKKIHCYSVFIHLVLSLSLPLGHTSPFSLCLCSPQEHPGKPDLGMRQKEKTVIPILPLFKMFVFCSS